jgi:hypothetical protein
MNGESLTWRFEVQVHGREGWLPYDSELWPFEPPWHDCLGVHRLDDCWDEPLEVATRELDEALSTLAGLGVEIGVAAARIVLWRGDGTDGDANIMLTATDEEMATGRLRYAVNDVRRALHAVDEARTRLRDQILLADKALLGRNTIARETEGALTRRLVLQLLAGYDLVREITHMLPRDWERFPPSEAESPWDYSNHLGPYWCGPAVLTLESTGEVKIRLVDRYGPDEPDVHEASREEIERHDAEARHRIREHATTVWSTVHSQGWRLTTPEGVEASLDDLANARSFRSLLIGKRPTTPPARASARQHPVTSGGSPVTPSVP